jgi:GTPase
MNGGSVKTGDAVLLGPDSNGNYQSTVIKSMQRKRLGCVSTPHWRHIMLIGHAPEINRATVTTAEAGQCVSFALKRVRRAAVRKGMVLVNKSDIPPRGQSLRPGTFHAPVLTYFNQPFDSSKVKCSFYSMTFDPLLGTPLMILLAIIRHYKRTTKCVHDQIFFLRS